VEAAGGAKPSKRPVTRPSSKEDMVIQVVPRTSSIGGWLGKIDGISIRPILQRRWMWESGSVDQYAVVHEEILIAAGVSECHRVVITRNQPDEGKVKYRGTGGDSVDIRREAGGHLPRPL